MVHLKREPRPLSGSRPLQHLQVAVGVAERRQGSSADLLVYGNWRAFFVVVEVEFGQADKYRLTVAHLVLHLNAAANHLSLANHCFFPENSRFLHQINTIDFREMAIYPSFTHI